MIKVFMLFSPVVLMFVCCKSPKEVAVMNNQYSFSSFLSNYHQSGDAVWKKTDKIISCNLGEGFIYTKNSYQYFHLTAEFLPDETVNSGIFFGCEGEDIGAISCYEANIWDNHPNQDFRTGSLVTRQSPMVNVQTSGKWSTYEIKSEPKRIRIWIRVRT